MKGEAHATGALTRHYRMNYWVGRGDNGRSVCMLYRRGYEHDSAMLFW